MLQVRGISKRYDSVTVLDRINLQLESRQTHVLLGSSGCGKSTLLRIVLGLLPASEGEVFLDDLKVTPDSQPAMAKRAGYVIQSGGLFPHLTARENVCLRAKTLGWEESRREDRFRDLCNLMELERSTLNRYPQELSGGQQQRIGLMRAIFLDPDILMLDEPLGALDPVVRGTLQLELKHIFDRLKKTVLLVTHDISEAAFLGHTVTLLDQGRVAQHGTMKELLRNPSSEFVSQFINSQRALHDGFLELGNGS